jgi:alpha-mannosidase
VSNRDVGITLSPIESHLLEFGGLWPCYVSQAHHGFTPPGFGREFVTAEQLIKGHMYAFVMDSNFRTNFQPVQQGDMLFRYSLTSHAGPQTNAQCRDFGWSAHNPLIGRLVYGPRDGALGGTMSFCQVDAPNVLLTTIKRAEDGRGMIVRLIETDGKDTATTLTLPHVGISSAWRTSLVEEDQAKLSFTGHSLTVPVRAFGIATLRLETY